MSAHCGRSSSSASRRNRGAEAAREVSIPAEAAGAEAAKPDARNLGIKTGKAIREKRARGKSL